MTSKAEQWAEEFIADTAYDAPYEGPEVKEAFLAGMRCLLEEARKMEVVVKNTIKPELTLTGMIYLSDLEKLFEEEK